MLFVLVCFVVFVLFFVFFNVHFHVQVAKALDTNFEDNKDLLEGIPEGLESDDNWDESNKLEALFKAQKLTTNLKASRAFSSRPTRRRRKTQSPPSSPP